MAGFFDGNNYYNYRNLGSFLGKCLQKKYFGYNIYGHYSGKSDFLFLLDELMKYDYNFDIIDTNGRILEIRVKIGNNRFKQRYINFRDSYAIMQSSLKIITNSFSNIINYPKIEYNFDNQDKKIFTCLEHKKLNCFECYNKYDTIGLYESIKYFESIINNLGGNLKLTSGATSLNLFRNKYLHKFIPNINYEIISGYDINHKPIFINPEKIIRNYYIGGRSEIFKRECEYEFYYDVNSLYPFVMQKYDYPVSNPIFVLSDNLNFNKDKGFAFVKIKYYPRRKINQIIPFLPIRLKTKYSNKLIYPVGEWEGLYDLDILRKAKELGYNIIVKYAFIFNYDRIFEDYINDLYQYRLKNDALKIAVKYLLNAFYGKFAQKRLVKSIIKLSNSNFTLKNEKDLEKLIPYNDEFGLYKIEQEVNSKHIIPSISSRVTSMAQLELYKLIEKCNHDITYCDTDAIITPEKLKTGKGLGEVKLEFEIDKGIFLLPKTYYIKGFNAKTNTNEEKIVMKGFTNNNFTYQDFYDALYNNDYKRFDYKQERLWGFKESMKRKNKFLTFAEKVKGIKSIYDKRIILDDNIHTVPLTINNQLIINR